MSAPDEPQTVAALAAHLRKTEIIAAITFAAASTVVFVILGVVAVTAPGAIEPKDFFFAAGFGCLSASTIITIRSFAFVGPLAQSISGGFMNRRARKAILHDDDAVLTDEERSRAPRWAAVNALNLQSNLTSSALFVLGMASAILVPQSSGREMSPIGWILGATLAVIVILDAITLRRMLQFRRYARRAAPRN